MNRLTDRLQIIADEVKKGETMADIGTDHGFLPLYLWEKGISPKVIMCDISEPSLAKAKGAAGSYQFGSELSFRAGDGLRVLDSGEVDDIVIAGMGGLLIVDILSDDRNKTMSFKKYIFQPRNNSGRLRYWLVSHGFDITRNQLVREGKFICEVITAISPKSSEKANLSLSGYEYSEDSPYWDLPKEILGTQRDLAVEYARIKEGIDIKILEGIKKGSEIDDEEVRKQEERLEYWRNFYEL